MKELKFLSIIILSILFLYGAKSNSSELTEKVKSELKKSAKEFTDQLKSVLIKEMQINGVASAVSVCSDTAQTLTKYFGSINGIYIKRVSFKIRNPENIPDNIETEALKYFEKLNSKSALSDSSEFIRVIKNDGVKVVYYLQPIVIKPPCLACHGQNISPEVKSILNKKYPDDKAFNYKAGDLRGAVSIKKTL